MASFEAVGDVVASLGFDDEVTPPWVMVPAGGTKRIRLKDGPGLTVALRSGADGSALTFRELNAVAGGRIIELAGQTPRTVFLDAKDSSGAIRASLEISVKKQLRLATFIAFVFDKAGRAPVRGLTDALSIMGVANKLLLPQTNVEMFRKDSGGIRLPFEMPGGMPATLAGFQAPVSWKREGPGMLPCISSRPPGLDGCMPETSKGPLTKEDFEALVEYQMLTNIVNRINPVFDYNILCVRNLSNAGGIAAVTGAFTPTSENGVNLNLCFMPDPARGQSLAHELCHFLLRHSSLKGGHSRGKRDLMSDTPGPSNIRIPKNQANAINPSGAP